MPLNRPPTLTVRVLTNELVEVYNWESLGNNLGIKRYKLQEIKKNRMDDTPLCKLDLFDLWLRSDVTASWEKIIKAVENLGEYATLVSVLSEKYLGIKTVIRDTTDGAAVMVTMENGRGQQGRLVASQQESSSAAMTVDHRYQVYYDVKKIISSGPSAVEGGDDSKMIQIVKMVLDDDKADVNRIDNDEEYKMSLLQHAVQKGDINFVKVLAAFGARVNYKNAKSMTALDLATFSQHSGIQDLLKKMGGVSGTELSSRSSHSPESTGMEMDMRQADSHHILTLDSSGPMAVVQLEILNQLEEETGKPIHEMFEWIVASGVGGFLLLAMLYTKRKTMRDLRRLYFQLWQRLFKKSGINRMKELERFAVEVFSPKTRMSDEEGHKVMIAAVYRESTQLKLQFFNNFMDEDSARIHVWKVACYTCATSYFGEVDSYIHGGAITKNLTDVALTHIEEFYHSSGVKASPITGVVSIGDGIRPARQFTDPDDLPKCTANALAELVHENCKCRCKYPMFYHRLNPLFPEATPDNDLCLENLIDLSVLTIIGMRERKNDSANTELDVVAIDLNN